MRSRQRACVMAVAAMAVWASLATAAQATTITIGSVLPPGSTPTEFGQAQTFFNTTLPEKGANLSSPVTGAIIRWRAQDVEGGPFYLRVLRPTGTGAYTAVGKSSAATPVGGGLQTFTTNLAVHAGDLIGVDPTNGSDRIGVAAVPGANFGFIFPPPFDGATIAPSGASSGNEVELSAEVQPAPAIVEVAPGNGSVKGGTSVIITGTNLTAASAVKFGTAAATAFKVESDTQITATAPTSKKVGPVDVSVTTLAGASATVRSDRFFYRGCRVPKLKGKTLKKAKKALAGAECRLGKVKSASGQSGKVLKQQPGPGKVLAPKAKVNVTVGR